jgi:hypothetical protein
MPLDANAVATALARYVCDLLPETAYGVAVLREGTDGETILGVYGKPGSGGRANTELALYEAFLAHASVEVPGRGLGPRDQAWAVIVRAGQLGPPAPSTARGSARPPGSRRADRRPFGRPGTRRPAGSDEVRVVAWWHALAN